MPTYRYRCEKCGHEFEVFQSIKAEPLTECPEDQCPLKPWGRGRVKRVPLGGAGLIFKGSGFYCTDYRSESYKQAAKKEAEAASGKTGKSDSGESKASTKSSDSSGGKQEKGT